MKFGDYVKVIDKSHFAYGDVGRVVYISEGVYTVALQNWENDYGECEFELCGNQIEEIEEKSL